MSHDSQSDGPHFEQRHGAYLISSDPSRLDLPYIREFLTKRAYWSKGVDWSLIEAALRHSLSLGVYDGAGGQVGFARIVTDYALFAYLRDVFIDEAHRGRGLGVQITRAALAHPRLSTVPSWMLATEDAHGVYEKAGFYPLEHPEWYMQRLGTTA
ncbi:GNAT family N-acetyltransferase [Roseovarius atlanticus]|uniref:GNAT family N-acetyltransferase n=1 Tax=Roseovarius atlanticus TaxID=1641875 RepID=UPI001C97FAA1|nr:GNAT family N-acetyltransferase [Roseovarius atlanticus]MBY5989151.1 GNAT family N-acetyltransferase [Roseovarius atlanticus]MBY6124543.1 GNAT family N-acetyltransferase [Roseovarius atlanticus]MBY6149038.1 GNAT family N-acetyltransferase [Roseovarius atlanticus]